MSVPPTPRAWRSRRVLVLLSVLATVAAVAVPTSGALAAGPGPAPAPALSKITVTPVTNIAGLPQAYGTPDVLIDEGLAFSVDVSLVDGVYSRSRDTVLVIESNNGDLSGTTRTSVKAGTSVATFSGLDLEVANGVVLTVRPVDPKAARELGTGSSDPFDVVSETELITVRDSTAPPVMSATGYGVPCQPTSDMKTCVDVLLPNGLSSDVFFSAGSCEAVNCSSDAATVLQVLADIEGRYTKDQPATLVAKCDRSLCGVGAIQGNVLRASLEPRGPLSEVPACPAKGVIGTTQESCVDYVQSKRDGSGDTYLYWLVTRDARMSF